MVHMFHNVYTLTSPTRGHTCRVASGQKVRKEPIGRAFTLIELLVVIAIIAVLMAILMPSLRRAKNQARDIACQGNLKQWSLAFRMYANDNDGYFPTGPYGSARAGNLMWMSATRPYVGDSNDLYLCPMATTPGTDSSGAATGAQHPNKAWGVYLSPTGWGAMKGDLGSYGISEYTGGQGLTGGRWENYWKTPDVRTAGTIPMFADCTYVDGTPLHTDPPPAYDGEPRTSGGTNPIGEMNHFCTNRHHGSINMLFMDLSIRKVGLKELWTLKWHRKFNVTGPYTRSGGMPVEEWPEWMRQFKDY